MGRLLICWVTSAALSLGAAVAGAEVVVLLPQKDNTLYDDTGGGGGGQLSNGQGSAFFSGLSGSGAARRGLLAFDVAGSLPPGSTINSVSLTLHMDMTIAGAVTVSLHSALADWGEGSSSADGMGGGGGGAPAEAGDATWLHTFFPGQLWASAGGDIAAVPSAAAMVDGPGPYSWGPTTEIVAEVQGWLDSPGSNFGWVILGDESASPPTSKRFVSGQGADPALRPQLTVDFEPPLGPPAVAAIPTLDTAGLVALVMVIGAAAGILLRRRSY